jgi:endonuclease-3 related protein
LETLFQKLLAHYGPQYWWPADTPFEVMLGAVLTQNTAWTNVEKAITNLKAIGELTPESLLTIPPETLAQAIKPSGYYNLKRERLHNLCRFILNNPNLHALNDTQLRKQLLSVKGIGPETADDIVLYAFERPVFVIDAYTRRLFGRLGLIDDDLPYEQLRCRVEEALKADAAYYNELHALIVVHTKSVCQKAPRCDACLLQPDCPHSTINPVS